MINPDELEEPVPPLSHLLFDKVTALRQEIVQIRDQRDNADTVQAFQIATAKQALQIAAAKQALQDVTEAVAEMEIEIARLRAELKTSNAERDEARRWVCQAGLFSLKMAQEVAIRRGWDCFKKEETT